MAAFNGFLTSLIKGSSVTTGDAVLTGISRTSVLGPIPAKMLTNAMFSVLTTGISGSYTVEVVGAVGGATAVIAGVAVTANGSSIFGTTTPITAIPRPSFVGFSSITPASGFTSSVFMMGTY